MIVGPVAMLEVWPGQELPDTELEWRVGNTLVDLSAPHAFQLRVAPVDDPSTVVFAKTTGISGSATVPNVTISWSTTGELSLLAAHTIYLAQLRARRTSDSRDRYCEFLIVTREVI